jgi:hypothetical protein
MKVSGLDPDQGLVKLLVDKVKEITEKMKEIGGEIEKAESVDENSVAKLFEEVKIMVDSLPSRIEHRIRS